MLEALEPRHLLTGFLQGTAFFDTNLNNQLDPNEAYKSGATILLQDVNGNPVLNASNLPVAPAVTDIHGQYLFDNLLPGTYHIVEIPIAGYTNAGTQSLSQFNPAHQFSPSTIEVTLVDDNSVFLNYLSLGQSYDTQFDFTDPTTSISKHVVGATGQINISLGDSLEPFPGDSDLSGGPFVSYCVDLVDDLQTFGGEQFQVIPMPTSAMPASGDPGRVAFLYNHYGQDPSLTRAQYSGLQLALWELTYDANPDLTSGNVKNVEDFLNPPGAFADVIAAANNFFALSAGKSEVAAYLNSAAVNPGTLGHQSMIATESFNFANTPLIITPDARISIAPDATNEVGQPHTFTVLVEADDGLPIGAQGGDAYNGFGPASGANVAVTLTGTNGAVPDISAPTNLPAANPSLISGTTDSNGHFQVTFSSATAGQVTGNATTTVLVGGQLLTRDTDPATANIGSGTGGSGPATKTFVDANINLSPFIATNIVNSPHTVTATVMDDDGLTAAQGGDGITGPSPAPNGTLVTFTLLNNSAGATFLAGNSCTTSGGTGTCSVHINSATPGSVVIHAVTTVTVSGVTMTRATSDSHPGDGSDASKIYVAGSIAWEKRTDSSPFPLVGGATFTVTPNPQTGNGTLTVVDNGSSDSDPVLGQFLVTGVPPGTYTITETIAPPGFGLDDDPTRSVIVAPGSLNAVIGTQGLDDPGDSDESDFHDRAGIIVVPPDKCNCSLPSVHLVNTATGEVVTRFLAYEPSYRGGVRVATGDLNGDGVDEIITAPGRNHSPVVKVFDQSGKLLYSFLAFGNKFNAGINVAVGDVNGDGKSDIVTAQSYNGNRVTVFLNVSPSPAPLTPLKFTAFSSFDPFGSAFKGGTVVAAADLGQAVIVGGMKKLDSSALDGRAEVIVGNGSGMRSTIKTFTYFGASNVARLVRTFLPFSTAFRGGVSLDVARINGDLVPEIVVAAGNGGSSQVQILNGLNGTVLTGFTAYAASEGPSNNAPVHVAALDENGDGIADVILTAQGTDGATRKIRGFSALSGQLVDQVLENSADFCGAYFLATLHTRFTAPRAV